MDDYGEGRHMKEMAKELGVSIGDFEGYVHDHYGNEDGTVIKLHLTSDVSDEFVEAIENHNGYEYVIDAQLIQNP